MATLVVAVPSGLARWRQRTVLEGTEYVLAFAWNQRETRWYLSVSDAAGNLLAAGIKLVVNWFLFYRYRSSSGGALPPGELVVLDSRASPQDPGLEDLGATATLVYFDAATVQEMVA